MAYQHLNTIIHPDSFAVLGLVIGDCVYSHEAKVLGKFLHHKLCNTAGEVLAHKENSYLPVPEAVENNGLITQAWKILVRIKDHAYPWVTVKETWSRSSLADVLYNTTT